MPRAVAVPTSKSKKATAAKGAPDQCVKVETAHSDTEQSSEDIDEEANMSKGRKRRLSETVEGDECGTGGGDYSDNNEMQRMLECLGGEICKARIAKKKNVEFYTSSTLKSANRRVEEIRKGQHAERQKLHDEFACQVSGVFTQWEGDVEKSKDQEQKLTNLFRQQQKLLQQLRIIQSQRLNALKLLLNEYTKGLGNLEKCHQDQQLTVQSEMKKEMMLLQKKMLMEMQQKEVASFKKSLQNMLY